MDVEEQGSERKKAYHMEVPLNFRRDRVARVRILILPLLYWPPRAKCRGLVTPSESGTENEKRINGRHQSKFSLSLGVNGPLNDADH